VALSIWPGELSITIFLSTKIDYEAVDYATQDPRALFLSQKIRTVRAQNGIQVSKKCVVLIMQGLDLCSVQTDAKKLYKKRQQYAKENLLKQEFSASSSNQI